MVDRRSFLKSLMGLTSGLMLSSKTHAAKALAVSDRLGELLPTRVLGRTGEAVTMLGVGGWHIGRMSEGDAQAAIEAALKGGIRFFDTAASYQDGGSEKRLGWLLTPQYRDVVFLMTKAHLGDAKSVQRQLEDSLRNLKTDHLDLWQMHQVMDPEDVESRVEKGVLDVFVNAKQSGKTRYIGFTGHRTPASHQRVLELTDIFDTCQMPINVADPSYGSFIYGVLPTLVERKIGVLAMKTLACGGFFGGSDFGEHGNKPKVVPDRVSMAEAIHFVWSLPVSTLITGPDNGEQLVEKINLAHSFAGMDEGQRQSLVAKVVDLAVRGAEFYKAPDLSVSDWTLY